MGAPALAGTIQREGCCGFSPRGVAVRLFLTCWLIYLLHFSPFVVRELYLTLSLAEKGTVHVDEYMDLHPDLFEIPGRGTYMGGNPGVSLLAAVPYRMALPVVNRIAPVRPPHPGEEDSAEYNEQRPMRQKFYRKARARGLELHLGAAAMITSGFFMAPLGAASVVVMYRLIGYLGMSPGASLGMALLYALGTPVFFRAGTMNLNLTVALLGLLSFALLWWPAGTRPEREPLRQFAAGLLAGWALLTDYTGGVTLAMLGLLALVRQMESKPFAAAVKGSLWFVAGAAGPVVLLLFWQWYCYGNPWLPAQFHQPKSQYAGYANERGFGWPQPEALWGLLFDPLYGLLVFAPILALALYHPVLVWRGRNRVPLLVAWFTWAFFAAMLTFSSCIQYTLRHQWQEGVRYVVPVVPFLFLLVADVMRLMPRLLVGLVGLAAVAETWCLAMVRENPLGSMMQVATNGLQLPWLTTLGKTPVQYFPGLTAWLSAPVLFLIWGVIIAALWAIRMPRRAVAA